MSSSAAQSSGAARLLQKQFKEMCKDTSLPGMSVGLIDESNVFEWEVVLMIHDDCKYYGGMSPVTRHPLGTIRHFPSLTRPHEHLQAPISAPT